MMPQAASFFTSTFSKVSPLVKTGLIITVFAGLSACGTAPTRSAQQQAPVTLAAQLPSKASAFNKRPNKAATQNPLLLLETNWEKENDPEAETDFSPSGLFVDEALAHLGVRYKYGGNSPDKGFDCSGLVVFVSEKTLGLKLPRRAEEIARFGQTVSTADLQPGDLVFYNTLRRKFSHVGIYVGEGKFVHAPSSGGVVRVESMDVAYWKKRFNGARRLSSLLASS